MAVSAGLCAKRPEQRLEHIFRMKLIEPSGGWKTELGRILRSGIKNDPNLFNSTASICAGAIY